MNSLKRSDEAFTGLEAAIVLIAFVIVAAVFAYVVLGAGFFTTQKSQETVYKGVEQSTTNIQMIGNVYGLASNPTAGINQLRFTLGLAPGAPSINLEKMTIIVSTPASGPKTFVWTNASSSTVDTNYIALKNGAGTSQSAMATSDQIEIQLNMTVVPKDTKVTIEIRPGLGAAFPFSKTTPALITGSNVLF